ncbi:MAG: FAD binding domain-containing protein [Microbacteriaceae bacterium]
MDLIGVSRIRTPRSRDEIALGPGDRPIGGGTWLYSEPQPGVDTVVDLTALGWPELVETAEALELAATCRLSTVHGLRERDWPAAPLFGQTVEALLASWKIWNVATIGGNLCFAVPASAMVSLATALDAELLLWRVTAAPEPTEHDEPSEPDERTVAAADWVLAPLVTALRPGEVLRSIRIPRHALEGRCAFRKIALADLGRSGVVAIARRDRPRAAPGGAGHIGTAQHAAEDDGARSGSTAGDSPTSSATELEGAAAMHGAGGFTLSVTAATARPHVIRWPAPPTDAELGTALDAIDDWFDDAHGAADWREAMTRRFARELRDELQDGPA